MEDFLRRQGGGMRTRHLCVVCACGRLMSIERVTRDTVLLGCPRCGRRSATGREKQRLRNYIAAVSRRAARGGVSE